MKILLNRNKYILERRNFNINFKEFISKNLKALKKILNKNLKNIKIENYYLRKKRELIELRINNNMLRDLNFFIIIVKTITTSSIITSLINILIKIKTLRLDRIYSYKNINKEKYLR